MNRKLRRLTHVLNFLVHAIVGTILFLVVGLPAVALDVLIHYLSALDVSRFTLLILALLEHSILIFDGLAVLVYIGTSSWRELKEMLK